MADRKLLQMPAFKRVYKKLYPAHRKKANESIKVIMKSPNVGEEKKGDLTKVFVHKTKLDQEQILIAYTFSSKQITLLALGTHENFYHNLKKQLQQVCL